MKKIEYPPRALTGLAVLLSIVLAGCHSNREKLPPETVSSPRDPKSVMVTVEPLTLRQVERMVGIVGTLHGYEEISLGAKVAGRVQKIAHDMSDRVAPGELLLTIDPTDHELNVRQAQRALQVELAKLGLTKLPGAQFDITRVPMVVEAQLKRDNAQARLDRIRTLVARKATSEEELTERMSDFRVAEAEYDNQVLMAQAGVATIQMKQEAMAMAMQQLRDTQIRVPAPSLPVPGAGEEPQYAIISRAVAEGSYVAAGDELFKLLIENPLKFRGTVPERKAGEVKLGAKAYVVTSAYDEPFVGEVTRINPAVNASTRTFQVEIQVPNPRGELKPGGFAKTGILTGIDTGAVTVPLEALVYFAGVTKLFLVEEGQAKEVQVTLGVQTTKWVEIATPRLHSGDLVVTSGQTAIADGTPVNIRSAPTKGDSGRDSSPDYESETNRDPLARQEGRP